MKFTFKSYVSALVAVALFLNYSGLSYAQSVVFNHNEQGITTVATVGSNININTTDGSIGVYDRMGSMATETINIMHTTAGSVALHRVDGPASVFDGHLVSNGRDFVTNANGITWGAGATVDSPGLIASTLNISNADFNTGLTTGKYNFDRSGSNGRIVSDGIQLLKSGSFLALLSPEIRNNGMISAPLGKITLASGDKMTLGLDALSNLSVVINQGVSTPVAGGTGIGIDNRGTISANGGKIILTAASLNSALNQAINNDGIIEANTLSSKNGQISLIADNAPIIQSGGSISAVGGRISISTKNIGWFVIIGGDISATNVVLSGTSTKLGGTLQATNLSLTGTGNFDLPSINVQTLAATVVGQINISNSSLGALTVNTVTADKLTLVHNGGDVNVNGIVTTSGDTSITDNGGNLTINANIVSANGKVDLAATGDVVENAGNVFSWGNLSVTADSDHNGSGDFIQNDLHGYLRARGPNSDVSVSGYNLWLRGLVADRDVNISAENNVYLNAPSTYIEYGWTLIPHELVGLIGTDIPWNNFPLTPGDVFTDNSAWGANFTNPFLYFSALYNRMRFSTNGDIQVLDWATAPTIVDGIGGLSILANNPLIAPLLSDWVTHMYVKQLSGSTDVAVIWDGIDHTGGTVNFEAILRSNGDIQFNYGNITSLNTVTSGISIGNGDAYFVGPYNGVTASSLSNANSVVFAPTVTKENIRAGRGINITAGGTLLDNTTAGAPLDSANLTITTGTGLGSAGHAIQTVAQNIVAHNTGTGDMFLNNTSTSGVGADLANAGGDVNFNQTGGTLSVANLSASHDANLTADNNILVDYASAGNNLSLTAGGWIREGVPTAPGSLTLTTGNDVAVDLLATNLSLTANNGIGLSSNPIETSAGQIVAHNNGTGDIDLSNSFAGPTSADLATINGNIAFNQTGGTLSLANLSASNNANVTADNNILVDHATAGQDLSLTAGGWIKEGIPSAPGSLVLIPGNDGSADIVAVNVNLTANNGIGEAANAIETSATQIVAHNNGTGDVVLSNNAVGGASVDLATVGGDVNFNQTGGTLSVANLNASHDASLTADNNILVDYASAGNNLSLTAGGWIREGVPTAPGSLTLTPGNDVAVDLLATNINLTATSGIGGDGNALESQARAITATNNGSGNIALANTNTGTTTFNALVSGTGDIALSQSGADMRVDSVKATTGNVSLSALTGAITQKLGGLGVNANRAMLSASTGIQANTNVNTLRAETNTGDIVIRQANSLALELAKACNGLVDIRLAAGAITDANGGDTVNVLSRDAILSAVDGIGATSPIKVRVQRLQLTNTNNDIRVTTYDGVTLANLGAGYAVLNTLGNVLINSVVAPATCPTCGNSSINDINVNGAITGGSNVSIINSIPGGNILLGATTTAGGGVLIRAEDGNINGNGPGPHVVAGDVSYLDALNGTIGLDGTVNVNINAPLILDIGGRNGSTSGILTGTVRNPISDGFPTFNPVKYPNPLYPPGNVFFNGIRIWPSLSSLIASNITSVLVQKFTFPHAELLALQQVNPIDMISSSNMTGRVFFYHPLSPVDSGSYNNFQLDEGAYDFIDGQINPKKGEKKALN